MKNLLLILASVCLVCINISAQSNDELFNQAMDCFYNNNYKEAKRILKLINPNDPNINYKALEKSINEKIKSEDDKLLKEASGYINKGEYGKAEEVLGRVYEKDAKYTELMRQLNERKNKKDNPRQNEKVQPVTPPKEELKKEDYKRQEAEKTQPERTEKRKADENKIPVNNQPKKQAAPADAPKETAGQTQPKESVQYPDVKKDTTRTEGVKTTELEPGLGLKTYLLGGALFIAVLGIVWFIVSKRKKYSPLLLIIIDLKTGKEYPFKRNSIKIGRNDDNDLVILDKVTSKYHAIVFYSKKTQSYSIKDLESKNGTLVNGKQIRSTELMDNDIIDIGGNKFRVTLR